MISRMMFDSPNRDIDSTKIISFWEVDRSMRRAPATVPREGPRRSSSAGRGGIWVDMGCSSRCGRDGVGRKRRGGDGSGRGRRVGRGEQVDHVGRGVEHVVGVARGEGGGELLLVVLASAQQA